MELSRSDRIVQLCESWISAPETGKIEMAAEQNRLHKNGIRFHELTYEESQTICVALTRVLLLPRLNTIIDMDHLLFWAWIGELFLSPHGPDDSVFTGADYHLHMLFDVAVRAALARPVRPARMREEDAEQQRSLDALEHNSRSLLEHTHVVLPFLAFPLLEAMTRRACATFMDEHGVVKKKFTVPGSKGKPRTYEAKYRCSSIADMLWLLLTGVADSDLKSHLSAIETHLSRFTENGTDTTSDGFSVLYDWRNSSVHGRNNFPTVGGTVMNLAILIALNEVRDQYEALRDAAWESAKWRVRPATTGTRMPSSYYPPFCDFTDLPFIA